MMNTATQVDLMLVQWIGSGLLKAEIVQKLADACLGWPYVWGGYGQEDTPDHRKSYANRSVCPTAEAEVIVKNCQVLNGKKSGCDGCKWYPGGRTRFFDCRGFVRWVFGKVGCNISGAGATSQWNTDANWTEKGLIKDIPMDTVCCVFQKNGTKMQHVGIHIGNGEIIHCSGIVKHGVITDKGWTHYAIPKNMEGTVPVSRPTLRKGSSGPYVTELQSMLIELGYDVGPSGADGKFGTKTQEAVKQFQKDHGLKADGVVGPKTWEALDEAIAGETKYTVTIPHLSSSAADALLKQYPDAEKTEEVM